MKPSDQKVILAIDEGTTNTKAVLVDDAGQLSAEASRPISIAYPQTAWVEQDAWEIWQASLAAAAGVLEGVPGGRVAALALTNQRESVLAWDRASGRPIGPCITWQSCRRAQWRTVIVQLHPSNDRPGGQSVR